MALVPVLAYRLASALVSTWALASDKPRGSINGAHSMPDGYTISTEIWGKQVFKRTESVTEMLETVKVFTTNGAFCTVEPYWNVVEGA